MIPIHLLSKISKYEVEFEAGVKVKATVIDHKDLIDENISELRSLLGKHRVVGMDVKAYSVNGAQMIVFCLGNRCLIIQLCHLYSYPESLKNFLGDESICFVGTEMYDKVSRIKKTIYCPNLRTGVEVGELAARILKKPELSSFTLARLAKSVGIEQATDGTVGTCPADWTARAFSHEEIKYAIRDAYTCYVIVNKSLDSLDANEVVLK